jgi:hypothetical protein
MCKGENDEGASKCATSSSELCGEADRQHVWEQRRDKDCCSFLDAGCCASACKLLGFDSALIVRLVAFFFLLRYGC